MKQIVLLLLVVISHATFGQTEREENPIDIELSKCLTSNQTTYDMIMCQQNAAEKWDKELNKYYTMLLKIVNAEEKKLLKSSQIKWIIYRDLELNFAGTLYDNMQGTMWKIFAAERDTDIIKTRVLELKSYYDAIKIDK